MELEEILALLAKYPNVKSIKIVPQDDWVHEIEFFYPNVGSENLIKTEVEPQSVSALINDMPPDDMMLYASTPTFDEMIDESKESQ